jgi:general secretion pathway protein D
MIANGMSFKNALKWILANVNADYTLSNQAVYITPKGQIMGDTIMQTYSILDLITPPRSFYGPDIQPGQNATITDPLDTPEEENRLDSNNIKELIIDKIARDTWDEARGTSIEVFQGRLIVIHSEEVQEQITNFLSELREMQTLQVVIQTRFIDVQEGAMEEIGVSWRGLDQASVNDIGSIGRDGAGWLSDVRRLDDYDARGSITNQTSVSSFERPWNPAPSALRMGLVGQFAILGNVQAEAIFHAVETSGSGIQLQAPSVTVFNNTTAHIDIAISRNYIRDYAVVDGNYDPTIDQFFEGVVLEVKPTVSSDRKYITMEVKPTIATLIDLVPFQFNALAAVGVAGAAIGPNAGAGVGILQTLTLTIEVPNIRYERLRTTVNLPDRSVVLLGGLMRSLKGDKQSGIPLLSNIPFLGRLFKNKSTGSAKDNLIISMSGRIVIFEEIENEL